MTEATPDRSAFLARHRPLNQHILNGNAAVQRNPKDQGKHYRARSGAPTN